MVRKEVGDANRIAGGSDQPLWDDLSADDRARLINRDVVQKISESRIETQRIVDAAMKDFEEDYSATGSKPMRMSVLRNIVEIPLPVDPDDTKRVLFCN